jgi:DNA-binding response OmpR family regulator
MGETSTLDQAPLLEGNAPRAIVVDDDRTVRFVVGRVLRAAGYAIEEAETGAAALRLAQTSPALLVVDVHLPDMSGLAVCRAICAGQPECAVLVLTGNDDPRTVASALSTGADDCLHKPVVAEVLVARAHRAVTHAAQRRALQQARTTLSDLERLLPALHASAALPVRELLRRPRA